MKLVLLGLLLSLIHFTCHALTVTKVSSSVTNGSSGGIAWTDLGNTTSADGLRTIGSANFNGTSSISDKLYFQNFGFSLPSTATIEGVEVQMLRSNDRSSSLRDNTAYLLINGVELGNNKADGSDWTATSTTITYGGSSDLWGFGSSLVYTTVNNSAFGFSVVVNRYTTSGPPQQFPRIDYLQMTITYSTALPADLISFQAQIDRDGHRNISWSTATETNTENFEVQRKGANGIFETIETVKAAGFSSESAYYNSIDRETINEKVIYYRLKQNDQNGSYELFDPISVVLFPKYELTVFPNPTHDRINITGIDHLEEYKIQLINLAGHVLLEQNLIKSNSLDLKEFGQQTFLLKVIHEPSLTYKVEQIILN